MNLNRVLKQKLSKNLHTCLNTIAVQSYTFQLHPYLVGGVVRDLIMSLPVKKDLDITFTGGSISSLAKKLSNLWKAKLYVYPEFFTFTLELKDGVHIDLITARQETYPYPACLPKVEHGTLDSDLARRDFSINAIALSISKETMGEVVDPLGGVKDIQLERIRILHTKSFEDDPTRIFRAARFAGRLKFNLEKNSEKLIQKAVMEQRISHLSQDRIRTEIEKILLEERPAEAIQLLKQWNVLEQIHPKLSFTSRQARQINLTETNSQSSTVKMSLWLFQNSLSEVEEILNKLNFSKTIVHKVLQPLILYHSFSEGQAITSLPRNNLFPETICFFDQILSAGRNRKINERWKKYLHWLKSRPYLDGNELKKMGYLPGPIFGKIIRALEIAKFEGEVKNRKEEIRFVIDNFRRD